MTKAVALLSGGLDSSLAVKMMIDQGIEVHALNFTSSFCTCDAGSKGEGAGCKSQAVRLAEEFGIPVKVLFKGLDYMEVVRHPKHGYGKGINPCVDCRLYMFSAAKKYMAEIGADFIITGEVLGQRPMSQRMDNFLLIEEKSGLKGLILRPLSAKHLEPTEVEKKGLVDRDKMLDWSGRSRRAQMDMAEDLEINDYPCPSGGCLLTDKIFSKKVRDLLDHKEELTIKDLQLLKAGRHFRYKGVKVVVGKDEADNQRLANLLQEGDTLIEPVNFPGPSAVVAGKSDNGAASFAGGLIMRYAADKCVSPALFKKTQGSEVSEMSVDTSLSDTDSKEFNVC